MYKSIIVIITLFFANSLFAQQTYDMPLKDGSIFYQEVGKQVGTPEELFERAFGHFKAYFPNFSSAITKKDVENNTIEGRYFFNITTTDKKGNVSKGGRIRCEFKMECKEGKYRVTLSNFRRADNSGNKIEEWFKDTDEGKVAIHNQHFPQINKASTDFIQAINKGMKPKEEIDDSW